MPWGEPIIVTNQLMFNHIFFTWPYRENIVSCAYIVYVRFIVKCNVKLKIDFIDVPTYHNRAKKKDNQLFYVTFDF